MELEELIEGKIQLDTALAITELRIKATEENKCVLVMKVISRVTIKMKFIASA